MYKGKWAVSILAVLLILSLSACSKLKSGTPSTPEPSQQPVKQEVTLYFADDQANYLVGEKRSVQVDKVDDVQNLAEAVVKELLSGPRQSNLYATFPKETRLLSVKIAQGVATVDFNKELQTWHSGGSSGEIMTIYSLVNSLTELPGIEKVQLLIDGQKVDSLAGHIDTSEPLTPDPTLIKK